MTIDPTVLAVFGVVYAGMIAGGIPGLAIDRTGIAVLGAIALLATGHVSLDASWHAMDVGTLALLLGLMVVSAQFRLGGFYTRVIARAVSAPLSPPTLLALVIGAVGLLSALLVNDVVCLAATPVIVQAASRRRLDPLPFLLATACASNVGSAATLIGNPQNMLVGQALGLSFAGYLADAAVPSVLGLGSVWAVVAFQWRGRWHLVSEVPAVEFPVYNAWQTGKGLAILGVLLALFLFTPIPRGVTALAAAGVLFLSRHMASRRMLGEVDWQLLVLFGGLFIVNDVLAKTGMPAAAVDALAGIGVDMKSAPALFGTTVVLSNLVSNVPAVMLLLPVSDHAQAGPILALASTLAGNLLLVGSIANLIVADQAGRLGVRIGWRDHARVGVPVTLATLALAALWLWISA